MNKMRNLSVLLVAGLVVVLSGCGPSKEKRIQQITVMEKKLYAPEAYNFSKEKADSLVKMYVDFITENPKDTISATYLFKAANIEMNSGDGNKALSHFEQYMRDFPTGTKAPMCMFFKAFVYENNLRDLDKAREIYLQFIEKYPKNDFADDAQMALKNLGKTPEMLIREFEEKQKADSARVADSLAKTKKIRRR